MGRPEFATDDRFCKPLARLEHRAALTAEIESWMAGFADDAAVLAKLDEHRVPCGPVLNPAEAINHEFFIERGAIRQVTDPLAGTIDIPGFPIRFSDAPPEPDLPVPALGQDNRAILTDVLGYSAEEIANLEEHGIIAAKAH
jgi:crotonobetainyl-CoA:carnitine CoA-transferase CaiB-like acyl-CoA transferase